MRCASCVRNHAPLTTNHSLVPLAHLLYLYIASYKNALHIGGVFVRCLNLIHGYGCELCPFILISEVGHKSVYGYGCSRGVVRSDNIESTFLVPGAGPVGAGVLRLSVYIHSDAANAFFRPCGRHIGCFCAAHNGCGTGQIEPCLEGRSRSRY